MLDQERAREILLPFGLELSARQIEQILAYLELLLRWNRRINLTAVRAPEDCLTRHFGESLFLARCAALEGRLLDVGSGAGFPGLALKIVFPELAATLLEPVAKKRAFLKEAARACGFSSIEVRPERFQEYAPGAGRSFDTVTMRAVGQASEAVRRLAPCLKPGGRLCLWLGRSQLASIAHHQGLLKWQDPISIPISRERVILIGTVS